MRAPRRSGWATTPSRPSAPQGPRPARSASRRRRSRRTRGASGVEPSASLGAPARGDRCRSPARGAGDHTQGNRTRATASRLSLGERQREVSRVLRRDLRLHALPRRDLPLSLSLALGGVLCAAVHVSVVEETRHRQTPVRAIVGQARPRRIQGTSTAPRRADPSARSALPRRARSAPSRRITRSATIRACALTLLAPATVVVDQGVRASGA